MAPVFLVLKLEDTVNRYKKFLLESTTRGMSCQKTFYIESNLLLILGDRSVNLIYCVKLSL